MKPKPHYSSPVGVVGSELEENFIGYYQVKSQRNPPNSELNISCLPTSSKQFSVRCTAEQDQRHKYKDVAHTRSVELAVAYYKYINILCTICRARLHPKLELEARRLWCPVHSGII